MELFLKLCLLALLLYPFFDIGIRWLDTKLSEAEKRMSGENCRALNKITDLCDWGTECHCFHTYMQQHVNNTKEEKTADMFECYPSSTTKFEPIKAEDCLWEGWVEKKNPGLVEEGTQPVEAETDDGEVFPGYGQKGG